MENNKYTIELMAGIKPAGDGTYPMVRAQDIEINNNDEKNRLSDVITPEGDIFSSKVNIGDGAKTITPNSMAIGRYRYGDTKAEHDGTLAIGSDNIAAGRYSIASGCETSTGVPLVEQKKYIINLLKKDTTDYKITKENESLKFTFETETQITKLTHEFDLFQYIKDANSNYKNSYIITVVMDSIQRVEKKDEEGNIIRDEKGNIIYEKIRYLPCLTAENSTFNIADEIQAWERLTDEEFSMQWHKSNFTLINMNLGNNSFATGFRCAAIGQSSVAIGGRDCRALADYSVVIGNHTNEASGSYDTIIGGKGNKITGNNSLLISTLDSTITGNESIGIGRRLKIADNDIIRIGKESGWNLNIDNKNTKCSLYNGLEIKYVNQQGHNIILGNPTNFTLNAENSLILGFSTEQYIRISDGINGNKGYITFTGTINLPDSINVPDNFIKNIWS